MMNWAAHIGDTVVIVEMLPRFSQENAGLSQSIVKHEGKTLDIG